MSNPTAYMELTRPHQFVKNGFVLLPILFGHRLNDPVAVANGLAAVVIFCLVAASVYAFNDIRDMDFDAAHPQKKNRPLPSGRVSAAGARIFGLVLLAIGFGLSIALFDAGFFLVVTFYLVLNLLYSMWLKNVAVIDVTCIAVGFVLRVFAGGTAANIPPSHWLVTMTFLLALFLALSKRRGDLDLDDAGTDARISLAGYSAEFVSRSMSIMAAVVIVAYIQYTMSPEVIAKHGPYLYMTAFWVVLGLLRYLQSTLVRGSTTSPTKVLIRDRLLQAIIGLWLIHWLVALYYRGH